MEVPFDPHPMEVVHAGCSTVLQTGCSKKDQAGCSKASLADCSSLDLSVRSTFLHGCYSTEDNEVVPVVDPTVQQDEAGQTTEVYLEESDHEIQGHVVHQRQDPAPQTLLCHTLKNQPEAAEIYHHLLVSLEQMAELRLALLWALEAGVLISPHSLVVAFVFVVAAAAAALSCLQTLHVEFSGSVSAVGRQPAQAVLLSHIQ